MEFLEHWKETPIVKVKFGANDSKWWNSKEVKNPKLNSPIPICDLDARVAAKQRICLHWHLASRLEMKLEIPCVGEEESATLNLVSEQTLERPWML
ncbi:hypothetical protein AVEN_250464-1 [Araneus ventricosus]|uniref:Uncharacterized protein n=1 Tax=Araneus ventricosus TaxID=182803 RepID=A0A4Y2BSX3_ARAVE|nr:hypothetical protein AVEN_250464-1 [Araneus ventricosus]